MGRAMCHGATGALLRVSLTVATAVVVLVSLSPSVGAAGGPAVTVKRTVCSMSFSQDPLVEGTGFAAIKVENGSNVVLQCSGRPGAMVNASGQTQTYKGFVCAILSPVDGLTIFQTFDTHATVTVNGEAQATCRYSKR
jgi:hypothetical protein